MNVQILIEGDLFSCILLVLGIKMFLLDAKHSIICQVELKKTTSEDGSTPEYVDSLFPRSNPVTVDDIRRNKRG